MHLCSVPNIIQERDFLGDFVVFHFEHTCCDVVRRGFLFLLIDQTHRFFTLKRRIQVVQCGVARTN